MMTNLFSIFDPSTLHFSSTNWLSIPLIFLFTPLALWTLPSRIKKMIHSLSIYIFSEFSPLFKAAPFTLISTVSLFFIIMWNNTLGLFPYIFTASSHMSLTLSLALPLWLATFLFGWGNNTSNLLSHLIPQGTPPALMPFMVLIETISSLIRPGTLAIRLAANMIAGHLLLVLLSSTLAAAPSSVTFFLFTAQIALTTLEIAVALIQAYVFSILTTLYMAECTQ